MEKFNEEDLLSMLPPSLRKGKELSKKQKLVLAQLIIYDGLDQSKEYGYFFRSNKDLCNDIGISEPTLIVALEKLEDMGFIERVRGKRGVGASEYIVFKEKIDDYLNTKKQKFSNPYKKELLEMSDRIRDLEILASSLKDRISTIEEKNFSAEAESEKEAEIEIELKQDYNKLKNKDIDSINNNILKENNKERIPIQSRTIKVETNGSCWIDNLFLASKDFEDKDSNEESWD